MRFYRLPCGPLSVNTYLVGADNTKDCVVIDPGEAAPVLSVLEKEDLHCTHILITHGHFDHIGGIRGIQEKFGALIYIHELDAPMLSSNRVSLASLMGETRPSVNADVLLQDGDLLDAAGLHFRILHTPGHSPGGVCYVLDTEKIIFCGDTLFFESAGRTDFPGCSQKELYHSIVDQLYTLEGDYTLYCGHDQSTTLDHERTYNPLTHYGAKFNW
ncbi:MAG: MBL fold metallo-hydrolase [Clostridia bacterium]